jgi:2-phosphosulfolactate phosphatase
VRIDVALVPAEAADTTVAVVIDVLRATTTITCALHQGYERVLACGEVDEARELAGRLGDGSILAGERKCVRPEGFDLGNSPRDVDTGAPRGSTLVLTTTNGTRAIVAADAHAEVVVIGCLVNLRACAAHVARIARQREGSVLVQCSGVKGELTLDDAYTAGRYVTELLGLLPGWEPTDAARAAEVIAAGFPTALDGLAASQSARNLAAADLYDDVHFCARTSVLDLVPSVEKVDNGIALITA